ncbi:MAG: hypothetical protein Q4B48_07045, partial [Syntrophomonadaceae bacterium]|nr:hypothetical protein [Syntrophomonadaceae bacterium]
MKRGKKALVLSLIFVFLLCVAGCTTAQKPTTPNSNSNQTNNAGNNNNAEGQMSYTEKVRLAQQIESELETMDGIDDVSVLVEHKNVLGDNVNNGQSATDANNNGTTGSGTNTGTGINNGNDGGTTGSNSGTGMNNGNDG